MNLSREDKVLDRILKGLREKYNWIMIASLRAIFSCVLVAPGPKRRYELNNFRDGLNCRSFKQTEAHKILEIERNTKNKRKQMVKMPTLRRYCSKMY